jgi:hypothetical protein
MNLRRAAVAAPWAAAQDLAASLRGKWSVDKVAALEATAPPFYKEASPEKKKEIRDEMLKSMPDMVVEFTADTASMTAGKDAPQLARYTVAKHDQKTLWLDMVPQTKDGPTAKTEKYTVEFVDPGTVKMTKEGDPVPLLLKRKK